jgi:hypothetical protein
LSIRQVPHSALFSTNRIQHFSPQGSATPIFGDVDDSEMGGRSALQVLLDVKYLFFFAGPALRPKASGLLFSKLPFAFTTSHYCPGSTSSVIFGTREAACSLSAPAFLLRVHIFAKETKCSHLISAIRVGPTQLFCKLNKQMLLKMLYIYLYTYIYIICIYNI